MQAFSLRRGSRSVILPATLARQTVATPLARSNIGPENTQAGNSSSEHFLTAVTRLVNELKGSARDTVQ